MRVSAVDLPAVLHQGVLTRYALLGPVAYVQSELPDSGTAGTILEEPCSLEHWGFILRGAMTLIGGAVRDLMAGTAFYVPPNGPPHRFLSGGSVVAAGFVPIEGVDASDEALRRQGMEIVTRPPDPLEPPQVVRASGATRHHELESGRIKAETAVMGSWLFTCASFGEMAGYASGWCELPHWGLVLRGDLAIQGEDGVELLEAGDVYYCPGDAVRHRFEIADSATVVDYTPVEALLGPGRQVEWRRASAAPHLAALRRRSVRRAAASGPETALEAVRRGGRGHGV